MKLQKTKEYSKFRLHQFNRKVDTIKYLEESIRIYGYIPAYPLHCVRGRNSELVIKDGHHRFEVCRRLGISVYYVVCDDIATIQELVRTINIWDQKDFLDSYVNAGMSDYVYIKNYHERTGIPLACCVSMLAGNSAGTMKHQKVFRSGKIQLGDVSHANTVSSITKKCAENGISFATNGLFVQALSKCVWVKEFNVDEFKLKTKKYPFLFEKQRSVEDYINMIENVYNRNRKEKIPLSFLASEATRKRAGHRK